MGDKIDNLDLRSDKRATLGSEIGYTGVDILGGTVVTEDRMPNMQGAQRYKVFDDLVRDVSIISAGVRLFLNLISKATWQVEPAEDDNGNISPRAQEIADMVADMMHDHETEWHRIVRRVAMYKFMGFTIHEWTAKKRPDGAIGMAKVTHRPQRTIARWKFEGSKFEGVWQRTNTNPEVFIPRARIIYAVDDALTDHPEGMGLLRHLVAPATRLQGLEKIEEIAYENDLRGMPVAYGPWKTLREKFKGLKDSAAQMAKAKAPFLEFVRGHIRGKKTGMLLDSDIYRSGDERKTPSSIRKWAVEMMRGDAQGTDDISDAIVRVSQEIARILGVEHLLLGADGSGSLALARSKVGTFYLTVISTQYELVEIMEKDWLGPLAEMNGWAEEDLPALAVEEVRDENAEEISSALANIARAGVVLTPDDPAVAEFFQMLGLTPPLSPEETDEDLGLAGNPDDKSQIDPDTADVVDLDKFRKGRHWIRSRNKHRKAA